MSVKTSVEFFRSKNSSIDHLAEEVTVRNGFIEENLYDSSHIPNEYIAHLVNILGLHFQIGVDLSKLQQFSFQSADGINYAEDKIMLVYSNGKIEGKDKLGIDTIHDDYCLNFFLDSKEIQFKFYDLNVRSYNIPQLPEGSVFAEPFGHGISPSSNRQDVYFCHSDMSLVAEHFNLPKPTVEELVSIDSDPKINKIFGLTFDARSLRPLKLKRYFYPKDPHSKVILYDEV